LRTTKEKTEAAAAQKRDRRREIEKKYRCRLGHHGGEYKEGGSGRKAPCLSKKDNGEKKKAQTNRITVLAGVKTPRPQRRKGRGGEKR